MAVLVDPVTGAQNWATVKKAGQKVILKATIMPNNQDAASQIVWSGGSAVSGDLTQRSVDKGISAKTPVSAQIGKTKYTVNVWVIWSKVKIQTAGTTGPNNNATNLLNGNFPGNVGGGNELGKMNHDLTPGLTYCYAIGKMQSTADLTPPGIGAIIANSAWSQKRLVTVTAWDNGGNQLKWVNQDDPCQDFAQDKNAGPTGGHLDKIYDIDYPGCSTQKHFNINHTSETYANFTQWATVNLGAQTRCSDDALWFYEARVDVDKPVGLRVFPNKIDTGSTKIRDKPFFDPR